MSTSAKPLGIFTARRAENDKFAAFVADMPDIGAGDEQFFEADRIGKLHLRPVLNGERTPRTEGKYPPGAHWIVYFSETGKQLRAIVKLPFDRRRNLRSNHEYAVRQVERFDRAFGLLFRIALEGFDPFTCQIAVVEQ